MMFRVFNSERGVWACEIDAFMYFLAYLCLAFMFSFVFTIVVEKPLVNVYKSFVLGQKVFPDHLYDFSPVATKRTTIPELGRKYEPVLKRKDSASNSNSTGSDGAESLDQGAPEGCIIDKHKFNVSRKQEYRTFSEQSRSKKEEQEHFAMIEPIASVADAEREFNDDLNIPVSSRKTALGAMKKESSEDEFIYF